ncbi:MAG: hypothetical protein K6T56_05060 [Burkholderiales bacterium]|jgi:hypothetical protein|nr:hypothetical protein [Burkholderiales bacterium]
MSIDILFHVSHQGAGRYLLPLVAAARRRGATVACFFTNDGVLVVADPEIKGALGDVRAVACEESWRRFRPHEPCPIEAGSQTDNSALMAQAQRVVSL